MDASFVVNQRYISHTPLSATTGHSIMCVSDHRCPRTHGGHWQAVTLCITQKAPYTITDRPTNNEIVRVRLVRSLVGCWLVIGPCVSPLARRVRVPCAALDFFGRADMQEDEIDAYDDFDYQAFDILLEQHQAAELNAHLEQEVFAAHERTWHNCEKHELHPKSRQTQ